MIRYPASPCRNNGVVFFVVTNINYTALSNGKDTKHAEAELTVGEMGYWVDTAITQMIQVGVEHSPVPDLAAFLGNGQLPEIVFLRDFVLMLFPDDRASKAIPAAEY